jgi:hypothetical protein
MTFPSLFKTIASVALEFFVHITKSLSITGFELLHKGEPVNDEDGTAI